jgi:hypothetical protein
MNINGRRIVSIVVGVFILLMLVSSAGYAEEGWRFELIPAYLWVPGFSGNLGLEDIDTPGDSPSGESLTNLDFGYLLHGEAWYNRFGGMLDALYVSLAKNAKAGLPELDVGFQAWLVDFAGLYRVYQYPLGNAADGRSLGIDLLAGGRYMSVDLDIDLFDKFISLGGNEQWADPIFGGRVLADFTRKFSGTLRGDVGGFGVNADLTWSVSGALAYNFTKLFSVWGGYRVLGMEYEIGSGEDRFKFSMTFQGPVIGIGFSF